VPSAEFKTYRNALLREKAASVGPAPVDPETAASRLRVPSGATE